MRFNLCVLTLVVSLGAGTLAADSGPTANPDVAAGIRMFEAWLNGQMTYRGLPGAAVGVIHDQDLVWSRGFGFTDVERKSPMRTTSLFRMASNTKMFTSIAVLQLRDAGKLRLDDPVVKYLPWCKLKPAAPDDPPITIENLLTHGSGLPREAAASYWVTFEFPSKEEVRKSIALQAAAYSPGVRFKYSNLALSLAGYIVEEVSGERYAEYIERHVLQPLGMTSSSIDRKPEPFDRLAIGYGRRMPDGSRKQMPWTDCKGIGPAAGLTSSVEDMARFVSLQFRGGPAAGAQILKGSTLREMHRIRFLENNWTAGNGLGFAVWRYKDKVYVGHGGSLAGYKTQTMMQLDDKIGVVVLTNGDDSGPRGIAVRAMELIAQPLAKAAAPREAKPAWDPAWRKYAGLYRSIWGDDVVIETKDALALMDPQGDDPQASMLKLKPLGGGRFLLEGPTGGSAIGEEVTFAEAPDGTVLRMTVGYQSSERVK